MYIFTKFIYNEYIRPYFLSHVVSTIFASAPPPEPRARWELHKPPMHKLILVIHPSMHGVQTTSFMACLKQN
jgi:hypothetical protein